jgi:hypothetical protein
VPVSWRALQHQTPVFPLLTWISYLPREDSDTSKIVTEHCVVVQRPVTLRVLQQAGGATPNHFALASSTWHDQKGFGIKTISARTQTMDKCRLAPRTHFCCHAWAPRRLQIDCSPRYSSFACPCGREESERACIRLGFLHFLSAMSKQSMSGCQLTVLTGNYFYCTMGSILTSPQGCGHDGSLHGPQIGQLIWWGCPAPSTPPWLPRCPLLRKNTNVWACGAR